MVDEISINISPDVLTSVPVYRPTGAYVYNCVTKFQLEYDYMSREANEKMVIEICVHAREYFSTNNNIFSFVISML